MNKLNLIITDRAKEDISIITDYIAKDNKNSAKAMSLYLYKICGDLAMFPNIGVSRPDFTYRDFENYNKEQISWYPVKTLAIYKWLSVTLYAIT